MTSGEYEYDTLFHQCGDDICNEDIAFPGAAFTLWVIFLITMPILFTNFLVSTVWISYIVQPLQLSSKVFFPHVNVHVFHSLLYQTYFIKNILVYLCVG